MLTGFDFAEYFSNRSTAPRELRDFAEVLASLGDPQKSFRCVHVGGTNGKGSTSTYIASILAGFGVRTGLYTSPALTHISERMRIDGTPADDALIERASFKVACTEAETGVALSGFDRMTASAFVLFEECGVEVAVLEVGLGGRLDATNVVDAEIAVLTTIALDHTHVLGSSYEEIAAEKCGIIKPGQTVICHPQCPEVMDVVELFCERQSARLIRVEDCEFMDRGGDAHGQWFTLLTPERACYPLFTRMIGAHQKLNAAAAVLAAQELYVDAWAIERGIASARIGARSEYFAWNPDILVDGAHNPNAARALINTLDELFPNRFTIFIVSIMADKDADEILRIFSKRANMLIAVGVNGRSTPPEELIAIAQRHTMVPTHAADAVGHAYEEALRFSVDHEDAMPLIVVTGSFYLAGAMLNLLM